MLVTEAASGAFCARNQKTTRKLPRFQARLQAAGYQLTAQARDSALSLTLARFGLYPIYHEKTQAGLELLDSHGKPLYAVQYPGRVYLDFASIPPPVVRTLSFVENRELLNPNQPFHNAAIQWGRLAQAAASFGIHEVDRHYPVIGGSTLATQMEKVRHSPAGRTHSPVEKFRQMASASLRIYQDGPRTLTAQRRVIRDYLNSSPLSSYAGQGEVTGLGDGLALWYGADFQKVNPMLMTPQESLDREQINHWARDYREVLSLLLALRAPSRFLVQDPAALTTETDRYLRALRAGNVISRQLEEAALRQPVQPRSHVEPRPFHSFVTRKAADAVRIRLVGLLGLPDTYALDRLDLRVDTSINQAVQDSVTAFLSGLANPKQALQSKLQGDQLLSEGDPAKLIYSFTLYERGKGVNLLRVQTDSLDQPLSVNDGTKLQLGSTAKLRTLITYLEIVEHLHNQYAGVTPAQLALVPVQSGDRLTEWALQYLQQAPDRSLMAMLTAALDRHYSGSPAETFFTAGGVHHFENFEDSENSQVMTVRQGFEQSVNLVFIRIMRDIENYYKWRVPGASPAVLADPNNPDRARYLERFADQEGSEFLGHFYAKYRGQKPARALETLVQSIHPTPVRLAVIYRSVRPQDDLAAFSSFLTSHVPVTLLRDRDLAKLYAAYASDKFNLSDRGYLANVHPLELWLLTYLSSHPHASFTEVLKNSMAQRQTVYRWLFRPRERVGQDRRIGIIMEQDAFHEIWKSWRRLGYPFDYLVPSYATSIGVSGDTPRALAELAGILANKGIRYSTIGIRGLDFARGTPMETSFAAPVSQGERVLSPEITDLVLREMRGVVQNGTGRRALHAFVLPDGEEIPVAGKTGTGDNRFKVFARGGGPTGDRVVNRTAAFVFILGNRFFGTVTAFVPGEAAGGYKFTSALAVQILNDLAPRLSPLMTPSGEIKPEQRD